MRVSGARSLASTTTSVTPLISCLSSITSLAVTPPLPTPTSLPPKYSSDKHSIAFHPFLPPATPLSSCPSVTPVHNSPARVLGRPALWVLPKYFIGERSSAVYRTGMHTHMLAAFGAEANTVIVVGSSGSYYKLQFDPQAGGEMNLLKETNFLAIEEEH
ncbi:unnamed protein product [Closterium sp. Naga37s-1]|nr:unnamed protein product [Closterium sp. Naga37s-1]